MDSFACMHTHTHTHTHIYTHTHTGTHTHTHAHDNIYEQRFNSPFNFFSSPGKGLSFNFRPKLDKRTNGKNMTRQPSAFPLKPATPDETDPFDRKRRRTQPEPIYDRTLDVVNVSPSKSSGQLELQPRDSAMYGNIDEEGDSIYELIHGASAKEKGGQKRRAPADQEKIVPPRPKKASSASQGTPIEHSFLSSEGILKVGCYDQPPSTDGDSCYEELPCNFGGKSEGDNESLPPLDKGRPRPNPETSATDCSPFDKIVVGPQNRKPMPIPTQEAASDEEVYETAVDNLKRDSVGKKGLVSQRSSYIYGNDLEIQVSLCGDMLKVSRSQSPSLRSTSLDVTDNNAKEKQTERHFELLAQQDSKNYEAPLWAGGCGNAAQTGVYQNNREFDGTPREVGGAFRDKSGTTAGMMSALRPEVTGTARDRSATTGDVRPSVNREGNNDGLRGFVQARIAEVNGQNYQHDGKSFQDLH